MPNVASPSYSEATARARATNHKDLLEIDGRSAEARRFRDLVLEILQDQGGLENCAQARIQLIRRFAAASVIAEALEAKFVNGQQIDIGIHGQLCSSLVRIAQRIGINRRLKNVTQALADYIESATKTDDQQAQPDIPEVKEVSEEAEAEGSAFDDATSDQETEREAANE